MHQSLRLTSLAAIALVATAAPVPLAAQAVVQSLEQSDADLLAAQMRQLAVDPRDMTALVTAAELSLKLGDLSGAAALYARADKINPRNGRVKAGMGSILVRSERPGEALRFFQQAEKDGYAVAAYAADRGLAYDLIGQQERAQRDYRVALAGARADETVRRYALSLGISGRQAEALEQLDPLVRRQDRAGWRARAFVLAMNGDTAAANTIATTMMPAQLAQGLGAFFTRLPALSPIDRAFAVHFGEIYPTPERLADAKLAPTLAPLPNESRPPVQVAAAAPSVRDTRATRQRPSRTAAPTAIAPARIEPTRTAPAVAAATVAPAPAPIRTAPAVVMAPRQEVVQAVPSQPLPDRPAPVASAPVQVAARPVVRPAAPAVTTARPAPVASAPALPPRAAAVPPVQSDAATRRADAVLARIVASLTIPASELGIMEATAPAAKTTAPVSAAGRRVVAGASAKEARDTAVRRAVAATLTGDATADDPAPVATRGRRGAKAVADVAPLTPAEKRAADRKTPADKAAAAEKKALADKAAAEKKAARANPQRVWVQVASGANEGDLARAWSSAKAKSPASFAGRSGYTVPLRATNRVLTGPFKTDAEARAFVNKLAKEGVSSYAFTSDPGQQVARLPSK